ncbi:hypothetical protein C5B90_17740 [Haloferax sp. Atlit-12N]|nr:hypothetical protein C5B90_17740 [Haloferax sp. Atlit-12N]
MLAVLTHDGVYFGVTFGTPFSPGSVWEFVAAPNTGVNLSPGVPVGTEARLVVLGVVAIVVKSLLAAGYFGSLADQLKRGEFEFFDNVRAHGVPFLVLTAVPSLIVFGGALALMGTVRNPGTELFVVVALSAVAYFVATYFVYATPYLIVLRDVGLFDALRASVSFAVGGGAYFSYFLKYGALVLGISFFATILVVNVPGIGLLVGVLGGGLLGLALNATTMRFVADIDSASPSLGSWDDDVMV